MAEIEAMVFEPTGPKKPLEVDPNTKTKKTKKNNEVSFVENNDGLNADEESGDDLDNNDDEEVPDLNVVKDLFNVYGRDRDEYKGLVYAKLVEIYRSYTSDPAGGEIKYTAKKNLFSYIMFGLRDVVDPAKTASDAWSYQFHFPSDGKPGTIQLVSNTVFQYGFDMETRLDDNSDIILFSLVDIVCLSVALKSQQETLRSVSTRKTGQKSVPVVTALIEKLARLVQQAKDFLRPLKGTIEELEEESYLLGGEPIAIAVQRYEKAISNYQHHYVDFGVVGIYFDFTTGMLDVIKAYDTDVPSAKQLDAAYELMLQHPDRIVVRDLRSSYKKRRNWAQ